MHFFNPFRSNPFRTNPFKQNPFSAFRANPFSGGSGMSGSAQPNTGLMQALMARQIPAAQGATAPPTDPQAGDVMTGMMQGQQPQNPMEQMPQQFTNQGSAGGGQVQSNPLASMKSPMQAGTSDQAKQEYSDLPWDKMRF